jgi:ABC-type transport system involved in multi-copper enzyme maturation permease subunit
MATRQLKPRRDDTSLLAGWESVKERAPSEIRADQPQIARSVAFVGLLFVAVGASAIVFSWIERPYLVSPGWGSFLLAVGVGGLLFHAFNEKDMQYRRLYGALAAVLLAAAVVVSVLPVQEQVGRLFLPAGVPCLLLALFFGLSFARNEDDEAVRMLATRLFAAAGAVMIAFGFLRGNIGAGAEQFLVGPGVLLMLVGLLYVAAYIGMFGAESPQGYRGGLAIGAAGVVIFVVALARSVLPPLFHSWGWLAGPVTSYLVPSGLLLMLVGLVYFLLAVGLCSDVPFVALTRRELAAYFYSPLAYIIIFALMLVGWWLFWQFAVTLLEVSRIPVERLDPERNPLQEPIVRSYLLSWWPFIAVMFVVPVLTMRLLSEEQRTGTLEMLLTAPVRTSSVVLSKFVAAFVFFLIAFLPWGLFLVALRVEGGQPFDYRPLLSYFIAVACAGAGFVSMGLFFSSLTRNQIAAAIITFVGMVALFGVFFVQARVTQGGAASTVLKYISFVDLWLTSLDGKLAPRFLVFHVSAAAFWLFLTGLVLESRRWK